MSQLRIFNGGLNTRLDASLIQPTEAVICSNVDLSSGILKPIKESEVTNIDITSNIYYYNEHWVSFQTPVDYVEFNNILYYSDGINVPKKSTNGSTWYNLGIAEPTISPILGIIGSIGYLNGTYQYCYTYYNSSDGTESAPSPYTDEVTLVNQEITLSLSASNDIQVTNIRLYRLGGTLTTMSLVVELLNEDQDYIDYTADIDIIGTILTTTTSKQAPVGLTNLTTAISMLFGSVDNKLYYSDIAYTNAWSPFNFITFDGIITAIGAVQTGLIVCTMYKTYFIAGNAPETFSKYLLSASQGCVSHKTMKYANNTLIWLSTDGICATTGNNVEVISRDKLGKLTLVSPVASYVFDDIYYLAHSTGVLLVDTRFGITFSSLTILADSFGVRDDELYYSYDNKLYRFTTNAKYASLHYKTGDLDDGSSSNLKTYKTIYVKVLDGQLTLKVFIDTKLVGTYDIDTTTSEILVPQISQLGYFISFEVEGPGILREIEYKVEGRQNGR